MEQPVTQQAAPPVPEANARLTGEAFIVPGRTQASLEYDYALESDRKEISMKITSPKPGEVVEKDILAFEVDLQDYETEPDGAHVHVIVDNLPYQAYYLAGKEPFQLNLAEMKLEPGVHTIRAFPARPWHESIKVQDAFAKTYFYYKKRDGVPPALDGPLLTFSRPKGKYTVTPEENRVLLDYFVSGAPIDAMKYKVRYTLNDQTPVTLTTWSPVWLEGLPKGEHSIKLELLTSEDAVAQVPFNPTERTFEIAYEKPKPAAHH